MTDLARAYRKANSFVAAWQRRYGVTPPKHTVILGLCQPSAETQCGDAWKGPDGVLNTADDTRNWGATTVRSLRADESAAIKAAGIVATVGAGHIESAKQAQAALEAAGLGFQPGIYRKVWVPRAEIHCDSRPEKDKNGKPIQVPYFVWFAAFDLDENGLETSSAEYYLSFVADAGNPARAVLDNPKGNVSQLAAATYARGYYTGFKYHGIYTHPGPDKILGTADDEQRDGNAENIAAYAAWLAPHFATWTAALKDWSPTTPDGVPHEAPNPPVETLDLSKPEDQWKALQLLGCVRPMPSAFTEKRFRASIGFYQGGSVAVDEKTPLNVDGDIGKIETIPALRRDLGKLGIPTK